ncbi:MFS transporter [Nonomuraea sp. NPDC059023]|uniref:MFS transporter n=1 Tax=unclassified Nonomuraea TaxID=2593643 RepID=UPI0036C64AFE
MTGRWQMVAALTLCVAIFSVNWTVLDATGTPITWEFSLTPAIEVMLAYAYPVALLGVLIPVKGRLSVLLWGLAGFGLVSAVGAFAVNGGMLVASRVGQGLAAAIVLRAGFELARTHLRGTTWWPAVAIPAVVALVGLNAGPVIGSVIAYNVSFRWILLVCVPLTVVAVVAVALFTPRTRPVPETRTDLSG